MANGNGTPPPRNQALIAVVALLSGLLISGAVFIIASLDKPTRDEVIEVVRERGPYSQDRAFIQSELARISAIQQDVLMRLRSLETQMASLLAIHPHSPIETRPSPVPAPVE